MDEAAVGLADLDVDFQRARGSSAVSAVNWADIGVIATDGDLHVAVVGGAIVRGIEGGPAEAGDVGFDPRM